MLGLPRSSVLSTAFGCRRSLLRCPEGEGASGDGQTDPWAERMGLFLPQPPLPCGGEWRDRGNGQGSFLRLVLGVSGWSSCSQAAFCSPGSPQFPAASPGTLLQYSLGQEMSPHSLHAGPAPGVCSGPPGARRARSGHLSCNSMPLRGLAMLPSEDLIWLPLR